MDANSDPQGVDYIIPGNDDAIRAIACMLAVADACLTGAGNKQDDLLLKKAQKQSNLSDI